MSFLEVANKTEVQYSTSTRMAISLKYFVFSRVLFMSHILMCDFSNLRVKTHKARPTMYNIHYEMNA